MRTFLEETVLKSINHEKNLAQYIFVLPSKRACFFLKKTILSLNKHTQFSPKIVSIEEFVEEIADIKVANSIDLLFEFYNTYLNCNTLNEKEPFEGFLSWAPLLIDDFNEIDRNLINQNELFSYLKNIKELEHWSLSDQQTPLIKNYIAFWNTIPKLYKSFVDSLKESGQAHQGYVFREATKNLEHYVKVKQNFNHVFIGFNALNTSEQTIIKELLELTNAQIYWDAERFFMERAYHDASRFHREIKMNWKYYQTNEFNFISNNYISPKSITLTGCTKNIGQTKFVAELLQSLTREELEKTALVLADESLLIPVLNSLPSNVSKINITMGLPLKHLPITSFFEEALKLHQEYKESFYFKKVLSLINHPIGKIILPKSSLAIKQSIYSKNQTQLSFDFLLNTSINEEMEIIKHLFSPENQVVKNQIRNSKKLLLKLKDLSNNELFLESLFKLNEVWNRIDKLNDKYAHIKNTKSLLLLFKEIVANTTINFQGEPNEGLQIMGLLETRSLDFENVILVGANEGILPAGKSNKSYIPYDLRKQYRLPVYSDKDAVYSYHFYSLLHRAKTIYITYNNSPDGLNAAEKSRFLMQLTHESPQSHIIKEQLVSPRINIPKKELKQIHKTPLIIEKIKSLAAYGLSPSALTSYLRNPIDFYEKYILNINQNEEVEETVSDKTIGTIVHDTLQHLYEPYINKTLTETILKNLIKNSDNQIAIEFSNTYKNGNIKTGKNHIIFEISKRYVHRFLKEEYNRIKKGDEITITDIENNLEVNLSIPNVPFPVKLRGKVDRIDSLNKVMRIIDYKTGKVEQSDLNLQDWELLFTDYKKHSKKIQVLCYALMAQNQIQTENLQAGIISFRNLNAGFMPFNKKESSKTKVNATVNNEVLNNFQEQLNNFISEICNPNIPFIEKEIPTYDF